MAPEAVVGHLDASRCDSQQAGVGLAYGALGTGGEGIRFRGRTASQPTAWDVDRHGEL